MDKQEFKKNVKAKLKSKGYRNKGNNFYKVLDKDYLIGLSLDHNPYSKGYFIEYGVVYLPDERKFPFQGYFDWSDRFLFTKQINDNLQQFEFDEIEYSKEQLTNCFEYEVRSPDDLLKQLEINMQKKVSRLEDKEYVLKFYKNNLDMFAVLPEQTIEKLLRLYEFDRKEINRLRRLWGYNKCDF